MVFVEAREAVVWDLIPGRPRSDEEVEPWAYARVAVECAEANGDFVALGPLATEPKAQESQSASKVQSGKCSWRTGMACSQSLRPSRVS